MLPATVTSGVVGPVFINSCCAQHTTHAQSSGLVGIRSTNENLFMKVVRIRSANKVAAFNMKSRYIWF